MTPSAVERRIRAGLPLIRFLRRWTTAPPLYRVAQNLLIPPNKKGLAAAEPLT